MLEAAQQCWSDPQYWRELYDWMLDQDHPYLPAVEEILKGNAKILYDEKAAEKNTTKDMKWDVFTPNENSVCASRSTGKFSARVHVEFWEAGVNYTAEYIRVGRRCGGWFRCSYSTFGQALDALAESVRTTASR